MTMVVTATEEMWTLRENEQPAAAVLLAIDSLSEHIPQGVSFTQVTVTDIRVTGITVENEDKAKNILGVAQWALNIFPEHNLPAEIEVVPGEIYQRLKNFSGEI